MRLKKITTGLMILMVLGGAMTALQAQSGNMRIGGKQSYYHPPQTHAGRLEKGEGKVSVEQQEEDTEENRDWTGPMYLA